MARGPRFIPPGSLVEITTRTIQGRFLLRPGRDLNEIVYGILGRAARRYDVKVCAFVFLSNHAHLLLRPRDVDQLAGFMNYVNGNLAKEAGRLHFWKEKFWGRRYNPIPVSDEEEAQVHRLRYLLSQGCKERLVRSPKDWPGASSTEALLDGKPVRGIWFDRTAEYGARRRGERFSKYTYATEEELALTPLPCWRDLPEQEIRERVAAMVREIEVETRKALRESGSTVLGKRRILRQNPHDRPKRVSRSPAPRFHAATREARKALELAFYAFRMAYRQAVEDLISGRRRPRFPPGSFPPRLPFVADRLSAAWA